jgi:hypothetical protein
LTLAALVLRSRRKRGRSGRVDRHGPGYAGRGRDRKALQANAD